MKPSLIARQKECGQLTEALKSNRSEFVIVCGRRRIGKTFLIDQFFKNKYDFTFVGAHKAKTATQLRNFSKAIKQYSRKKFPPFSNWYDAFDALEEYLETLPKKRKKVIFIDEMPWIDTNRSPFVEALENFWNGWANRRYDIVLIASGSATSWMADNLIENQGGLHNRITRRIYLKPFTLKETEEYFKNNNFRWSRYDILQCYMLTGGVPYYLNLLDPKLSIAQNIDTLCFDENGALRKEINELYPALFNHAENYINIVTILYNHKSGLTRKEIAHNSKLNGKYLSTILENLEQCNFIAKMEMFGHESTAVYRLIDFYTLFYYKFIADKHKLDGQWWSHHLNDTGIRSWQGLSFELICMQHHQQIKKALGISGIATNISTWKCNPDKENDLPGAQIDMIIERADRMIHLCEMKFSEKAFNISNEYEKKLRDRMWLFDAKTKNKKTLVNTFVTTFGLGEGKHHSIVHSEVTMDDLFNS
ncbi:MAG: ATP-binding protein [Prevotella sp.]|nr:ATP-binding protein [Prevotella sp.]